MESGDILNLALSREQSSREFYNDLLEIYQSLIKQDGKIKDLFLFLISEKNKHIELIERKIKNLYSQKF